VEDNLNR